MKIRLPKAWKIGWCGIFDAAGKNTRTVAQRAVCEEIRGLDGLRPVDAAAALRVHLLRAAPEMARLLVKMRGGAEHGYCSHADSSGAFDDARKLIERLERDIAADIAADKGGVAEVEIVP